MAQFVPDSVLDYGVGLAAIRAQHAALDLERDAVASQYLAEMTIIFNSDDPDDPRRTLQEFLASGDADLLLNAMEGFKITYGAGWAKFVEAAKLPSLRLLKRVSKGAYNDGDGRWCGRNPIEPDDLRPPHGTWVVYQLLLGDELVYIGSTGALSDRIKTHSRTKEFDSWRAAECKSERHCRDLEAALIDRHRPPLNRMIPKPRMVLA